MDRLSVLSVAGWLGTCMVLHIDPIGSLVVPGALHCPHTTLQSGCGSEIESDGVREIE